MLNLLHDVNHLGMFGYGSPQQVMYFWFGKVFAQDVLPGASLLFLTVAKIVPIRPAMHSFKPGSLDSQHLLASRKPESCANWLLENLFHNQL